MNTHNKLIVQRLKFEAAMLAVNILPRRCGDRLILQAEAWNVAVVLNNIKGDGIQVRMQALLGRHPNPDAGFLDFIASANNRDEQVEVELTDDAEVCVRAIHDYAEGIVASEVISMLSAFTLVCGDISHELREGFFVQPVEAELQGTGDIK
jgi:hypothetical protein